MPPEVIAAAQAAPVAPQAVVPAAAKSDLDALRGDLSSLETHVKTVVEQRLQGLEASAKTDLQKVESWVKTNWPHFVSWTGWGLVLAAVKHII